MKLTTQAKMEKFTEALVKAFGEGSIISRQDVVAVWLKNKDEYPHLVSITKNLDYRAGRGMYVATMSETPAMVRDVSVAAAKAIEQAKEKELPKSTRTSIMKLAAEMKKVPDAPKKTKRKEIKNVEVNNLYEDTPTFDNIMSFDDVDDMYSEDVNDIVRVMRD